jgi:adenylate cyclase
MAFWGAPMHNDNHARDALAAALEIVSELSAMCRTQVREGMPEFKIGIGISSGVCNVGNMGSEFRMAYTVVGDTVNVAERLERQTRIYKVPVIVSESTARQLPDMLFRELDTVQVKGRHSQVKIFQPICPRGEADESLHRMLALHARALTHYRAGEYIEADELFRLLYDEMGNESIYAMYLERIAPWIESPVSTHGNHRGDRAYH